MKSPIDPQELQKLLEDGKVTLVDVRRRSDYEADPALIPGAAWQDPEQVARWGRELPAGKPVVVYCVKGGSVSQSVTETLTRNQVEACYVAGGIKAWKEAGGRIDQ
jgi:rhodanese-related sulfurtransferase